MLRVFSNPRESSFRDSCFGTDDFCRSTDKLNVTFDPEKSFVTCEDGSEDFRAPEWTLDGEQRAGLGRQLAAYYHATNPRWTQGKKSFPKLVFAIKVRRKSRFYHLNFILPCTQFPQPTNYNSHWSAIEGGRKRVSGLKPPF